MKTYYKYKRAYQMVDKEVFEFVNREDFKERLAYLKKCMMVYRAEKERGEV